MSASVRLASGSRPSCTEMVRAFIYVWSPIPISSSSCCCRSYGSGDPLVDDAEYSECVSGGVVGGGSEKLFVDMESSLASLMSVCISGGG